MKLIAGAAKRGAASGTGASAINAGASIQPDEKCWSIGWWPTWQIWQVASDEPRWLCQTDAAIAAVSNRTTARATGTIERDLLPKGCIALRKAYDNHQFNLDGWERETVAPESNGLRA